MRGGVDQPRGMQTQRHAEEGSPEEHTDGVGPAAPEPTEAEEQHSAPYQRNPMVLAQPDVEAVAHQVGNIAREGLSLRVQRVAPDHPAGMGPPAALARRVRVAFVVTILVMDAMYRYPEDGPSLERERGSAAAVILFFIICDDPGEDSCAVRTALVSRPGLRGPNEKQALGGDAGHDVFLLGYVFASQRLSCVLLQILRAPRRALRPVPGDGKRVYALRYFVCKVARLAFRQAQYVHRGFTIVALILASFYVFPSGSVNLMFAAEAIRGVLWGLTVPLLWAMMADVADYSEWKNHRRATGIVFSALVFGQKAGLGLGGALAGFFLTRYGYAPNAVQTERALEGIRLIMSIVPAVTCGMSAALLCFNPIDKATEEQIRDGLAERRNSRVPIKDELAERRMRSMSQQSNLPFHVLQVQFEEALGGVN